MKTRYSLITALLVSAGILNGSCQNKALKKTDDPVLKDIQLPKGFSISIYANDVQNARSLALGDKGTVFVGNRSGDKVYGLVDENNDGKADKKYVVAKNMNSPNGVAFRDGALFIAEIDKIWRIDNIESNLANPPAPVLVSDKYPNNGHHGWKYIAFGPDGKLYVPVGAPCNICNEEENDPRFASITRMNADGSGLEIYAKGIRNTVGFDWHPETKELWFTENGRDNMGDNVPPDELNIAAKAGMHFGYPFCHGGNLKDPKFGDTKPCNEFTPPVVNLDPHVAALGIKYYRGNVFPAEYRSQVFIAEHGSWNRTEPIGYRIMLVRKSGGSYTYTPFATGWLKNGKAWGRPVDILELKDGSLLVSDDFANAVYRISYSQ